MELSKKIRQYCGESRSDPAFFSEGLSRITCVGKHGYTTQSREELA